MTGVIVAGIVFAFFCILIRNNDKWKNKIENQLLLERIRLVLVFVITNNLKITFKGDAMPESSGHIKWFQFVDGSYIKVALDEDKGESLIISSVPIKPAPTRYCNLDTSFCRVLIDVEPNAKGDYPSWALKYHEKIGEEFIDERFPIEINLGSAADPTIRSYVAFDKILFNCFDEIKPFPIPKNPFGGIDNWALEATKQGGWERERVSSALSYNSES